MRLKLLSYVGILLLANSSAFAQPAVDNYQKIGSGTLHYFVWKIYDATLYAQQKPWSFDQPFALTLEYKLFLNGQKIAERSVEEIRKLGFNNEETLKNWGDAMTSIFPDVDKNTTLIGYYTPNQPTAFYHDGQPIGTIDDPEFGRWFFGIWLDKNTTEPYLRQQLLGNNP